MTSKIFTAINHVQSVPSSTWTISHNFLSEPQCDVVIEIGGNWTKILPSAAYALNSSQYRIEFTSAIAGRARLVGNIQYVKPATLMNINGAGSVDPVIVYPNSDTYIEFVSLLMHGDGANLSSTFTDSSVHAHVMTGDGNVNISTAQSKFGNSSINFTGGFIKTPLSSEFLFGTGDFTLEVAWYPENINGFQNIINVNGYNTGILWRSVGGTPDVFIEGVQLDFGAGVNDAYSAQQWQHIALVRATGQVGLFINGAQIGNWVANTANLVPSSPLLDTLWIGRAAHVSNENITGYLDEIRITKGVARYTGPYSIPADPFPNPI